LQPFPWTGGSPATGLAAAATQQVLAGLPVGYPPTQPRLFLLKVTVSDPAKYELSLKSHNFNSKTQEEQALFLYKVVQDVFTLGKNVSHCEPAEVMTVAEKRNFASAQQYRKGKSFIPKKSSFCRIVDPFFECLHDCYGGDFAVLREEHRKKQFKYGKFKDTIQILPCHDCAGKLQQCWTPKGS
jgi:hypothetical protein